MDISTDSRTAFWELRLQLGSSCVDPPEAARAVVARTRTWRSAIEVSPPGRVLVENDEGLDFSGEVTHFFDCLDTGHPCMTDARDVRQIMELVLGAYEKAYRDGGN